MARIRRHRGPRVVVDAGGISVLLSTVADRTARNVRRWRIAVDEEPLPGPT
jgi:hypothetical protein